MGLHQIKKLLTWKNQQNKNNLCMGKIIVNHIYLVKDWYSKYMENSDNLVGNKTPNNPSKNAQRNWIDIFSKEDIYTANKYMKSADRQSSGKCKLKPEIPPHTFDEWQSSKIQEMTNVGEDVEKREHLYSVGRNINWFIHHGK